MAYVNPAAGTVVDTRPDAALCGEIDAVGDLAAKVEYAVRYIDNEVENRLAEAEADIAAQGEALDAKIAEVQAQVEKLVPPPVGTVKFTASQSVEPGWLRCDGSFVSEDDYPELVAALGKLTPGVEDYQELLAAKSSDQMTNGVFYGGRLWVYLIGAKKLVGVSPAGKKEIAVAGADGIVPLAADEAYLSITGGSLYLAQTINHVLEAAAFTGNETALSMTALAVKTKAEIEAFSQHVLPYVAKVNGKCYLAVDLMTEKTSTSAQSYCIMTTLTYLSWEPGRFSSAEKVEYSNQVTYARETSLTNITDSVLSLHAFSHKNSNDLLIPKGC